MKCPKCNSTRYTKTNKGSSCKKCGYTNIPMEMIELNKLEIKEHKIIKNEARTKEKN